MLPPDTGAPAFVTRPVTVIPSSKLISTSGATPLSIVIVLDGAMRRLLAAVIKASTRTRPSGRPVSEKFPFESA